MIAPVRTKRPQDLDQHHHEPFLSMLPQIRSQARLAFRCLRPNDRQEMIQEVIANAYCAFVRLLRRGKANIAYASPLADYAIRQAIAGRRVGTQLNSRDITSRQSRVERGICIESLDTFDREQGDWRAALIQDRRATPAETAAARIDVAAWLGSLKLRNHRIALRLAMGDTATEVAHRFGLSLARVSQIRGSLRASWDRFHGEGVL